MPKATEEWKKNKPLYKPVHSSRSDKKGMVYVVKGGKKRLIHFGDSSMTDFKRGASKEQRKSYLARSGGIKNKQGKLTKNDKNSANYWSRKINW
jgi:L-ascorbate metabolism protein UlaG (beta-lactamase superfamily)